MSTLKELSSQCFNTRQIDLSEVFAADKSSHFVQYSEADAQAVGYYHTHNLKAMQEQIEQECETEVIQAIKRASARFVPIGGSFDYPMVIVDMLTREFNVLYGFVETRRGYESALRKQGFKANPSLYPKTAEAGHNQVCHNMKFDVANFRYGLGGGVNVRRRQDT